MPKGPKGQKRPAEMNKLAKAIVDVATGEAEENAPKHGRLGGIKGEARAGELPPERRREIAKKAEAQRWKRGAAE